MIRNKRTFQSVGAVLLLASFCRSQAFATKTALCDSMSRQWGVVEKVSGDAYRLFMKDNGKFPNNENHPLLLYKNCYHGSQKEAEELIVKGGWTAPWVWGIFTFHHYHSTAWELLLCVQGEARVQLGGDNGPIVTIEKGDVVLVPPGFAHKQLSDSGGFALLGSYPDSGAMVDTLRGQPTKTQRQSIQKCGVPTGDPVSGIKLASMY